MAYVIGDPNHIAVHNNLITELAAMGATNLPDVAGLGDLGHVADHNLIRSALIEIGTSWGVTGTPLPPVASVGGTGHVDDHNTIDAAIAYLYANGWNRAEFGTITDVPNYNGTGQTWRVHTFTSNGTLRVLSAPRPFRILVVGGGSTSWSGAYQEQGGGGGGVLVDDSVTLTARDYAVIIGAPDGSSQITGSGIGAAGGGAGKTSGAPQSFPPGASGNHPVSNRPVGGGGGAGGAGLPYNYSYEPLSGYGGGGISTNIRGADEAVAVGGSGYNCSEPNRTVTLGGSGAGAGRAGAEPGVVIVAYQIA